MLADGELLFTIEGNGFLYHMVRNIVWNLVEVGRGKKSVDCLAAEFVKGERDFRMVPAPAQGLYLAFYLTKNVKMVTIYIRDFTPISTSPGEKR